MELNMADNTQAIERRVDTIYTDQHLAMFPMYDDYCRLGTIAQAGTHPTWNPTYVVLGGVAQALVLRMWMRLLMVLLTQLGSFLFS